MPLPTSSPLAGIRDILVGITEEGRGDEAAASLGYGLTLAWDAGAHLTVQSAALRLTTTGLPLCGFAEEIIGAENGRLAVLARRASERDSPKDRELTLSALEESQLANEVVTVRYGAEALEYLYWRGAYAGHEARDPAVAYSSSRCRR